MTGRMLCYLGSSLLGDALIVVGGVNRSWPQVVIGLVIAGGTLAMLMTGWWLRWERTVYTSDGMMEWGGRFEIDDPFERWRETGYFWGPGDAGPDVSLSRAPYDQEVNGR